MTGTWLGVLDAAALVVAALGLVVGALVLVRTGQLLPSLAALLEMLGGAGLLRLSAEPSLTRALAAGAVLLVRRLVTAGLRGAPPVPALVGPLRQLGRRASRAPG